MAYRDRVVEELSDLTDGDVQALVGLIHHLTEASRGVSSLERAHVAEVALACGEARFWAALDEAETWESTDRAWELASSVAGADARELIYATLAELAMERMIDAFEAEALRRLEELWGLVHEPVRPADEA